jgi:hypothetical protein
MAVSRGPLSNKTGTIKRFSESRPWQQISPEVMVKLLKKYCISNEMDGRIRKLLGMLAVDMRV